MADKLTPKQAAFVREYLVDLNATQAAVRAGYSAKTAHVIGHENLSKPAIAAAVGAAQAQLAERTELTVEWVLNALKENYDRAMQATPVCDREGKPTGEFTYQGAVATRAAELIGKHVGMWKDSPPPSAHIGVQVWLIGGREIAF